MDWWFCQIQSQVVDDFIARFKSAHSDAMSITVDLPRSVSDEDNDQLLRPIQGFEIKEAVFQMDKYKAPSSDGFGATFFQDY